MSRQSVAEALFGPTPFSRTGFEGLQRIRCPRCGEVFACRDDLVTVRRKNRETIWCPNGHTLLMPKESGK